MNHPEETMIHDFVDDELSSDDRSRVAAHLAECASCRVVAGWARRLKEEAARELAEATTDEADVPDQWARISARIGGPRRSARGQSARMPISARGPRPRMFTPARAAAVIVLVAVSSATTWALIRSGAPAGTEIEQTATGAVAVDLAVERPATAIAAAYTPVFMELERILAEEQGRLQPETIATLESNLEILNAAIRDIEEALATDPANRGNLKSLDGVYQAKLGLLRQAVTLSPEV